MIDLRQQFKHLHWRVMGHSQRIEVASDFADYPEDDPMFGLWKACGLWTIVEANILYNCAKQIGGNWLDIGCHTGWTTSYIAEAGCRVIGIDPMLKVNEFASRFRSNTQSYSQIRSFAGTANEFFEQHLDPVDGVCIDGEHIAPLPLEDAVHAALSLKSRGVILLHDAVGKPVHDAVLHLIGRGFKCKVYPTPHVVAVCWRGEFTPPAHEGFSSDVALNVSPQIGPLRQFLYDGIRT